MLFDALILSLFSKSAPRSVPPPVSYTHLKQLNRMVEVIRVLDFTNVSVHMKEILYVKVLDCSPEDKTELFQIAETFKAQVIDYGKDSLLLEFFQTSGKNDSVVRLMKKEFHHRCV